MSRIKNLRHSNKPMGNLWDTVKSVVNNTWYGVGDAINYQTHTVFNDPVKGFTNFIDFTKDTLVSIPLNISGSLYTASTGQKNEIVGYASDLGKTIAQPATVSSTILANVGGDAVYSVFPWINYIHQGVYEIQKGLFPNSLNPIETIATNSVATNKPLITDSSVNKAGIEVLPLLAIAGGAMALTYLFDDKKSKKKR